MYLIRFFSEFRCILRVFVNFAEFRGSATARNIRSSELPSVDLDPIKGWAPAWCGWPLDWTVLTEIVLKWVQEGAESDLVLCG